jgi:hypothetical protein
LSTRAGPTTTGPAGDATLRHRLDLHRDVAGAIVDPVRPTLGSWPDSVPPPEARLTTFIDERSADDQRVRVDANIILGVGGCAFYNFIHGSTRRLWCESQHREGFIHG